MKNAITAEGNQNNALAKAAAADCLLPAAYADRISSHDLEAALHKQSHLLIVSIGAVIGSICAICIGLYAALNALSLSLILFLPFALPYLLRHVCIRTLAQIQTQAD